MFTVITCSIIALLLTYLESHGQMKNGMKFGFFLIAFLGAIHYDYGNDYMPYLESAISYTNHSFNLSEILSGDEFVDFGWVLLCWFFKPFGGFFVMVAVLNVVQNIIVYKFIKNNVDLKWRPLAVFVYLFTANLYLLTFSMMRQMFVMMMFLGMWKYISHRNWLIPFAVLFLCTFIHGSAIILLPFAFWGFVPMKNSKYVGLGYVVVFVVLWIFKDALNVILSLTMNDIFAGYVETYGGYDNSFRLGLGFVINMIPFILSILYLMKNDNSSQAKSLVALSAVSFLITPFSQVVSLVSRVGFYFNVFSIASLPCIYSNINNYIRRSVLLALYILITLYDYYIFFTNSIYSDSYSIFHTIFSQIF